MVNYFLLLIMQFAAVSNPVSTITPIDNSFSIQSLEVDTTSLVELDLYWNELSRTVQEGDFEGYGALYHPDAVIIFATGNNKTSVNISEALAGWKKGFNDTKAGKQNDMVEFRFSQRIANDANAHETGMFHFTSSDTNGVLKGESFIHFEMLLVKKDQNWLGLMEYQKSKGTKEEWDALK